MPVGMHSSLDYLPPTEATLVQVLKSCGAVLLWRDEASATLCLKASKRKELQCLIAEHFCSARLHLARAYLLPIAPLPNPRVTPGTRLSRLRRVADTVGIAVDPSRRLTSIPVQF